MTDIIQSASKVLRYRSRRYPAPPADCPTTALIALGRKGEARTEELLTAEQIAAGVKRRKITGIYRRGA